MTVCWFTYTSLLDIFAKGVFIRKNNEKIGNVRNVTATLYINFCLDTNGRAEIIFSGNRQHATDDVKRA